MGADFLIRPDYDIKEAIEARKNNDRAYFETVMPAATIVNGPLSFAEPPPSQRGWIEYKYPPIPASFAGSAATDVLIEPNFPLEVRWHDNLPAAFVDIAPDASTAIEIRYAPAHPVPQFVDAYLPIMGRFGKRRVGVRMEVYTSSGFDWGPVGNGGKIAGGLWGGGRASTGLRPPWVQDGITCRNIWSVSPNISTRNLRLYTYNLNRGVTPGDEGMKTGNVTGQLTTGQWQVLEYEGMMNDPGFANGFTRFWMDGEGIGAVTNAVWALNNEWAWRGPIISEAWQGGTIPQTQFRWLRNVSVYVPPPLDQKRRSKELVVVAVVNAVHSPSPEPEIVEWTDGTTEAPGAPMTWTTGTTINPGESMTWREGLS